MLSAVILSDLGKLTRFGSDLLSHVLRRSTIGAKALHGRARDGPGCVPLAMTNRLVPPSGKRTDSLS